MSMTFNDQQKEAIFSTEPLVVVAAGAGSGKTRVLTERVMYLCERAFLEPDSQHGAEITEISAITFTEKAAREMKQRIRGSLEEKVQDSKSDEERTYWAKQKEALDRAVISTFHSFCQRLLKQYAYQAGLPASFQILDDVDANLLKQDVFQALFDSVEFFRQAEPFIHSLGKDQLVVYLTQVYDQIRELEPGENIVQTLEADDMWSLQAKAKEEESVRQLEEFEQQAKQAIQSFPTSGLSKANQTHVDRMTAFFSQSRDVTDDAYVNQLLESMPSRVNKKWQEDIPSLLNLFENSWKPLKDRLNQSTEPISNEDSKHYLTQFIQLIQAFDTEYSNQKLFRGGLDFTDLQQKALTLLKNNEIQLACREELKHMMIDEFQDTNALQLEVLNRIQPNYRFIVGDTKQSIYQFRGADVTIMNDLEHTADTNDGSRRVLMNTNYRTVEPIVAAVNTLFSTAMAETQTYSYQTLYQSLKAHRELPEVSEHAVELLTGELDEYDLIANRMLEIIREKKEVVHNGDEWQTASWKDMAVLIPTRTHLQKLEKSLKEAQIPYEVQSGIGFYERREVVDFLMLLRWIHEPYEDFYVLALLRSPLFGLTIDDFLTIQNACTEHQSIGEYICFDEQFFDEHPHLIEAISKLRAWMDQWIPFQPVPALIDGLYQLFEQSGLKISLLLQPGGLQRVRNVEKLIDILVNEQEPDLTALLEAIQQRIEWSAKEGDSTIERAQGDAVTIMTVHGSKGLEFPIVFLPQLHQKPQGEKGKVRFHSTLGVVMNLETEDQTIETPGYHIAKAEANDKAIEEAKRLFYVATTRARDKLVLVKANNQPAKTSWLEMIEQADASTLNGTWYQERTSEKSEVWQNDLIGVYNTPAIQQEHTLLPVPLSVSQVVAYSNDPEQFINQYVKEQNPTMKDNLSVTSTHGLAASRLGTYVHRACELYDLGWALKESVDLTLKELESDSIYQEEMLKLVTVYAGLELGEALENEWAFSLEVEGAELTGIIDRVTVIDSKLCLLDIKTNSLENSGVELINRYRAQLILYKWAYEQKTGQSVSGLFLVVLRDHNQQLHEITVTESQEDEVREAVRELVKLKTTSTTIETYTHSYRYK